MEELWVFKSIQSTRKVIANDYDSAIITSKITSVKLDIVGTREQYSIHQLLLRKHSGYFRNIMTRAWLLSSYNETILFQNVDYRECE
jgi:hypothetical protein